MNNINDNWRNNKIKKIYCTNCGKYDHISKKCQEPIISYGLIVLKIKSNWSNIDINSIKDFFIQKYKFPNNQLSNMGSTTNVTNNYINAIDTKSFEDRLLGSHNAVWAANQYAGKSLAVNRGRA
jgi:hypothetical protein